MRQVFILTDLYPPAFAPRIAYLTQYLKRCGWEAVVFTEEVDEHHTFANFVPPCPVHRVRLRGEYPLSRVLLVGLELLTQYKERVFARVVKDYTERAGLAHPDAIMCFAYRKFPLRAAYSLSCTWSVPWIADCRDLVEQYSPGDWLPRPLKLGRWRLRALERLLAKRYIGLRNRYLAQATAVSTVSQWHGKVLSEINPRCTLIYNGYDPVLFAPLYKASDRFRLVFTGRLLSLEMRDPSALLDALEHPLLASLELEVACYTDTYSAELLETLQRRRGRIESRLVCYPMVGYSEVPELLHSAGIVLLLGNAEGHDARGPRGMISTKLFEAMAVQKPLLMLPATGGEAVDLLRSSRCGIASDSSEEIASYIYEVYRQWLRDGFTVAREADRVYIEQFSRRRQARLFADLLNQVIQ